MSDVNAEKLRLALLRMKDSRRELLANYAGAKPTYEDVSGMSRFVKALGRTIENRRRTELRGLGVFEWKPFRGKTPDGRPFNVWRLVFRFRQNCTYKGG